MYGLNLTHTNHLHYYHNQTKGQEAGIDKIHRYFAKFDYEFIGLADNDDQAYEQDPVLAFKLRNPHSSRWMNRP